MWNPFNALRQMARTAVINGVADAVEELSNVSFEPPPDLNGLRVRVAKIAALPAGEADERPAKRRKS